MSKDNEILLAGLDEEQRNTIEKLTKQYYREKPDATLLRIERLLKWLVIDRQREQTYFESDKLRQSLPDISDII